MGRVIVTSRSSPVQRCQPVPVTAVWSCAGQQQQLGDQQLQAILQEAAAVKVTIWVQTRRSRERTANASMHKKVPHVDVQVLVTCTARWRAVRPRSVAVAVLSRM